MPSSVRRGGPLLEAFPRVLGRMCAFMQTLQHLTSQEPAMTTPDEQAAKTFAEFDYDSDGYITVVEFKLAMTARREQVTGDELDSIFDHADKDNDGKINQAEFIKAWNA